MGGWTQDWSEASASNVALSLSVLELPFPLALELSVLKKFDPLELSVML
jgi:hypothetical protein